ncbi:hypothetical protein C4546_03850 [Candidatus Parcubacteria bacterium]|jgi:hypothetical protein|nr:MAG: hypothetical protein C4546_03850 [Candidatus Parcubacteria bacterium]
MQVRQLLAEAKASIQSAEFILGENSELPGKKINVNAQARKEGSVSVEGENRVIEGIFDGQHMVGPDGKQYSVPANYASKSKLVEGDKLKLTITPDGAFIYKQIGPIDRVRVVGKLVRDEQTDEFQVVANGAPYRVLLASITYFKGDAGDDVVILLPKDHQAKFAAVENIIKRVPGQEPVEAVAAEVVEGDSGEILLEVKAGEVETPETQDKIDEI